MGNTAVEASRALRLLNAPAMRHHPSTGPTERRAPSTTPGTPLNLGLLDYVTATVGEVETVTRAIAPDAGPTPQHPEDLYDWCVNSTSHADADQQAYRDIVIETHRLEHAVRLGEHHEVCKHPCPGCGRWGLMWDQMGNRARCSHRHCRTPEGLASSWTLTRLAAQKVQRTEIWRRNAT